MRKDRPVGRHAIFSRWTLTNIRAAVKPANPLLEKTATTYAFQSILGEAWPTRHDLWAIPGVILSRSKGAHRSFKHGRVVFAPWGSKQLGIVKACGLSQFGGTIAHARRDNRAI